ncbi:aspartate aminotransferase family protein [Litorilinea aerophila]|uniref:Aspartate aminotransferase family protein n=1 Tax=Litorilinea aerophila TaxID=1204385 RepID=A0A540VIX6_9CHLR|nr:aspartate aminotransferase family protein [Litorilinea aerophila]MCC9075565.1 aspartate aminotransferase family protein [Litorilinea aerophila]
MTQWQRSRSYFERARQSLAGGVSSNVRLLAQPFPLFFDRAEGALIYDVDGNAYIDYVLGQGPLILGHSHPAVLDAVNAAMRRGQLYAGQHELEFILAEKLVELVPAAELCRFGLSGSEMVQAAMRLARAVTGRTKILRFEGHYHGWFDNVLISVAPPLDQAGPRERPRPVAGSAGQVESALADFVVLPWNDLALVETLFQEMGEELAAVMLEPMMCNTGAIPPEPGYLEGLRQLCDRYGTLLYFDETITGFRLGLQGAQGRFGVTPDLASFAKAMAGGFANAALVGKREYMERFARDVNHSGTFNSNVISMAASVAAIAELERDGGAVYRQMERIGTALMEGLQELGQRLGLPLHVQGLPTAFHVSFTELTAIRDYRDYAQHCDRELYGRFVLAMLRRGVRLIGRGIWYVSAAHTESHVEQTLQAAEAALQEVATEA